MAMTNFEYYKDKLIDCISKQDSELARWLVAEHDEKKLYLPQFSIDKINAFKSDLTVSISLKHLFIDDIEVSNMFNSDVLNNICVFIKKYGNMTVEELLTYTEKRG